MAMAVAEVSSRSRSMIRFKRMEALTVNDGSVIYPFIQCQVLIYIHVFRCRAWIEPPGGLITSSTLVTSDPTIKFQFPLQLCHIFANKYLHTALVQLLSDNIIPEHFWDDFIDTVTIYLRYSADYAIQRKSGGVVLHVEVQVLVKEENTNVENMFAHILEEFIDMAVVDKEETITDGHYVLPSGPDSSWWELLAGFETVTFKRTTAVEHDDDDMCSICLDPYKEGMKITKMPCNNNSQHWFHRICILKWLTKKKKTCPICRWPLSLAITNLCFEWIPTSKYLY